MYFVLSLAPVLLAFFSGMIIDKIKAVYYVYGIVQESIGRFISQVSGEKDKWEIKRKSPGLY